MNRTKYKILMIVFILLFIGMLGCTIFMVEVDKQTENTTKLYVATVNNVEINVETTSAMIYTNEHATRIYITTNIGKFINLDDVKNLESGQTIYFRIENTYTQLMDEAEFLAVTSLKTDTKNIFSLEEYNEYMHHTAYPARITSIVVASLSLLAVIFCWLKIKKQDKR